MIELGIQKFLLADATLAAMVGTGVFNGRMPKETLPAVVIQVISSTEQQQYHLGAAGSRMKRIQIDTYASDYFDAQRINDRIIALLDGYSGALPDGTVVDASLLDKEIDLPVEAGFQGYLCRRMAEFCITYQLQ